MAHIYVNLLSCMGIHYIQCRSCWINFSTIQTYCSQALNTLWAKPCCGKGNVGFKNQIIVHLYLGFVPPETILQSKFNVLAVYCTPWSEGAKLRFGIDFEQYCEQRPHDNTQWLIGINSYCIMECNRRAASFAGGGGYLKQHLNKIGNSYRFIEFLKF